MEKEFNQEEYLNLKKEFEKKEKSMEERLWIDSNVGKFDDLLRTNYNKNVENFSTVIIEYLSQITNAYQGIFYIVDPQSKLIKAMAGYACNLDRLAKKEFEFGEDLVGQSALSRDKLIFEDLPPIKNKTNTTEVIFSPKSLIVMPLLFNKSVYGVLKFVFLKPVEEKLKLLLDRASQNVGAMLESIINNGRLKDLLEDSQKQAEQLRSQEEELRQNLEEMAATREAQERTQSELIETQVRFDLATETTTEGLWEVIVSDDLKIVDDTKVWWSDNFRSMLGFKGEEDFPSRLGSWSSKLHPEHKEMAVTALTNHLMDFSGQTTFEVEYRSLLKTGEYRWFRSVGNTLRDEEGKPLRVAGSLIDIQGEKDLIKAKEKFDLAAQTTTEGLWDCVVPEDLTIHDDTHFWYSDNLRHILGYENEEDFPNKMNTWTKASHPDFREKAIKAFNDHLMDFSGDTPYDIELLLLRKSGEYRWFRAVGNTLRDEEGKPLRVAGSVIDIQEEKDLAAAKERFNLVASSTTEGLYDIELSENLELKNETAIWVSDQYRRLLGYKNEEDFPPFLGSWLDLLHPEHKKMAVGEMISHLEDFSGKTRYDSKYKLLHKTGEYRWYRSTGNSLRDETGRPFRFAGSLIDIQESRDLVESKEKFNLAVRAITEGLWDLVFADEDDWAVNDETEVWFSSNVRKMFGFRSRRDFPNQFGAWANRIHPEHKDRVVTAVMAHFQDFSDKTPFDESYLLQLKSGEYRWFRSVGTAYRNLDGRPLRSAVSFTDIHEAKALNEFKANYEMLSEISDEGTWSAALAVGTEVTPTSTFHWAPGFVRLLGFDSSEEFPDQFESLSSRIHRNDVKPFSKDFHDFLEKGSEASGFSTKVRLKLKNGEFHTFRFKVIKKENGEILKLVGRLFDLDELNK